MPVSLRFTTRATTLAVLLAAAAASPGAAQQRVGVSTGVNPEATGIPPGAAPRRLVLGQQVVYNERITTAAAGQTQLLFLDESTLSVGPDADMVIDRFVYDPNTGTGALAASVTRGVFRFVGGRLSKVAGAVTLRTGTATIGIRGAIFLLDQKAGGRLDVIFLYGNALTVTGMDGISQTLTRPGFAITVPGPGLPPSPPFRAPPGAATRLVAALDGRTGGNGGATTVPTEAAVANSGISAVISGDFAGSVAASERSQPRSGEPPQLDVASLQTTVSANNTASQSAVPTNPVSIGVAGDFKRTSGSGSAAGFADQTSSLNQPYANGTLANDTLTVPLGSAGGLTIPLAPGNASFGPSGTASPLGLVAGSSFLAPDRSFFYADLVPVTAPTEREFVEGGTAVSSGFYASTGATRIFAFAVQPDAALQSNIPFVRINAGGNLPNATVSPLYLVAPAGTAIGDATTLAAARTLQASLAIDGQGASQSSVIAAGFGTVGGLQANGAPILAGAVRGSSLLSANDSPTRISSALSTVVDANQNSFYGGNQISGFALDQTQFSETATGSGVLAQPTASSAAEIPLAGAAANYGFTQPATATSLPAGTGAVRTTQTLSGYFGGLMNTTAQAQPYMLTGTATIGTDATTNRVAATFTGGDPLTADSSGVTSATLNFGGLTGNAGGREAFIDDRTFGAAESVNTAAPQQINGQTLSVGGDPTQAGKLYLLSSGAAPPPASLLPAGASYCTCAFLQWGYWGGDLRTGDTQDAAISRIDRGHINFWAAGVPTALADLQTLAGTGVTGTYNGHLIGSVFNNGAQYIAAGGLQASFNFGTQAGSFAVNNYDGHSFTATITRGQLTGANYTFAINQAGFAGSVNGGFYGPMAAETGGNFAFHAVSGPTYITSGIFAAKR